MTITIHNQDDLFICQDVGKLEGFESPSAIVNVEDVAGKDGAVYINAKYGRRRLAWQGLIDTSVPVTRRELIGICRVGQLKTLTFESCDGLQLQVDVEITRLLMPYSLGRTTYLIEAVAPDARLLSEAITTTVITQTAIGGGSSIPWTIPVAIVQTGSTQTITTVGTELTDPTITIHGPGTSFSVTNVTTGETFTVSSVLDSDDTVVIDGAAGTVIKNGTANLFADFSGSFLTLLPGGNELRFSVGSGSDGSTNLSVSHHEAFLGI